MTGRRAIGSVLLWAGGVVLMVTGVPCQTVLPSRPQGLGGDPAGLWVAEGSPLGIWASDSLQSALSDLLVRGSVTGEFEFGPGGAFRIDSVLEATLSAILLGAPLQFAVSETTRAAGSYRVLGEQLVLEYAEGRDTVSFTAGDSLTLIQSVPLGEFSGLVSGIDPSGGPVARLVVRPLTSEPLSADFDGSGSVDFADFVAFVQVFGAEAEENAYDGRFDLDGDGVIGFLDFLSLARQFGL